MPGSAQDSACVYLKFPYLGTPTDDSARQESEEMETQFLSALDHDHLDRFSPLWRTFCTRMTILMESGVLSETTISRLKGLASRVRLISEAMEDLQRKTQALTVECGSNARTACIAHPPSPSPSSSRDSDPYLPLRHWFLAHFTNPYPTIPEKEELMRRYPKHSKQQIDTWFTNIRRRSGWQEFKKKYSNGTTEDFTNLVEATEKENRTSKVEECRIKIEEIKGFLRDGGREKVSDSIQEIVKKGAPATSTRRKIQARQPRGSGGGGGGYRYNDSSSSSSQQQLPPLPVPFAPYQSIQVVTSPSSIYPTPLPSEPRHPSSFSSPTTSLRSVSDSSSSSFDSVLSYGSTSTTAPYDIAPHPSMQTPSSPPAMSSLLSFNNSTRPLPSQQFPSRPTPPPIENPYFFTLNNTPLLPLLTQPEPALASSSLAGFAANGDLIV